jgi:hypothetical protein
MKVKIPLESSKDTRDAGEPSKELNTANNATGQTNPTTNKHERISIETQINHAGEVNKARYMP